jgi:hypothetical protein
VQVLVVGFDDATFSGSVLEELARLGDAGIVRLVDVLLVRHTDEGTFETLDVPGYGETAAALLAADGPAAGDAADGATWSLADAVPRGSTAAVALLEHLWAGPLVAAIRDAGGSLLEETWLPPDEVARLEAALAGRRS